MLMNYAKLRPIIILNDYNSLSSQMEQLDTLVTSEGGTIVAISRFWTPYKGCDFKPIYSIEIFAYK